MPQFTLHIMPWDLTIAQYSPDEATAAPDLVPGKSGFWAQVNTPDELSIVGETALLQNAPRSQPGWRALRVQGPLDFALVGVLAELAGVLARHGVSIFAMSTFDTDYLLVQEIDLPAAVAALRLAGHKVLNEAASGRYSGVS